MGVARKARRYAGRDPAYHPTVTAALARSAGLGRGHAGVRMSRVTSSVSILTGGSCMVIGSHNGLNHRPVENLEPSAIISPRYAITPVMFGLVQALVSNPHSLVKIGRVFGCG